MPNEASTKREPTAAPVTIRILSQGLAAALKADRSAALRAIRAALVAAEIDIVSGGAVQ